MFWVGILVGICGNGVGHSAKSFETSFCHHFFDALVMWRWAAVHAQEPFRLAAPGSAPAAFAIELRDLRQTRGSFMSSSTSKIVPSGYLT